MKAFTTRNVRFNLKSIKKNKQVGEITWKEINAEYTSSLDKERYV